MSTSGVIEITMAAMGPPGGVGGIVGGDLQGALPNPTIRAGAVDTGKLANLAVTDAKIAAVSMGKVTGLADALLAKQDVIAANTYAAYNDVRLSDTRTPTDNTVSTAKLVNGAVTNAKIADVDVSKVTGLAGALAPFATTVALGNEVTRATNAEGVLDARITTEINARIAGDAALDGYVQNEVTRATAAEVTLAAADETERLARINAVNLVAGNLAAETSRAQTAEDAVQDSVDAETLRAGNAETALGERVDDEIADRAAAVAAAQAYAVQRGNHTGTQVISTVVGLQTALDAKATQAGLDAEIARATTAEGTKLVKTSNLGDLTDIVTARTNLGLGTAATQNSTAFDAFGAAAGAQAFSIQRANHTGTQSQNTVVNLVSDLAAKASQASLDAEAAARVAADALLIPLTQKGAANGVATLGADSKIPGAQLPALAIGETFQANSQAAMLALTAQRGDMAVRTDLTPDGFFLLTSDSPGTLADWVQITAPGAVVSVDGATGAVDLSGTYAGDAATTAALATKAADSDVVKLSGNQTAFGRKKWSGDAVFLSGQPWWDVDGAFDGATNDSAAFVTARTNAPAGAIIKLRAGTTRVDDTAFVLSKSNTTYSGAGREQTVVKARTGAALSALIQTIEYVENIVFENMTFDGNGVCTEGLVFGFGTAKAVQFRNCRFRNLGTNAVKLDSVAGASFDADCVFDDEGRPRSTGIHISGASRDIDIAARFLWMRDAVIVSAPLTAGAGRVAEGVRMDKAYVDQGWYLLLHKRASSGGAVTYTSTTLTDTAADFTTLDLAVDDNVRVMPVRASGTATALTSTSVTVSGADFITAGVIRGDTVRMGASFAVVAGVESAEKLVIEEWWDDVTRARLVPALGTCTVYRTVMGRIQSVAATTLTIQYFHDLLGHNLTPSAGTRYEVLVRKGNYGIHAEAAAVAGSVTRSTLRRVWSDQVSVFGSDWLINGNLIEDGQDMGVTAFGARHDISNNRIRRQGASAIFASGDDLSVTDNTCVEGQCQNWFDAENTGIISLSGNRNLARGNKLIKDDSVVVYGMTIHGGDAKLRDNDASTCATGYRVLATATDTKFLDANDGTVSDLGARTTFGPVGIPKAFHRVGSYDSSLGSSIGTGSFPDTYMYAMPWFTARPTRLDRIGVEITTALAASVVRLGLYADDGKGHPGALVLDAGTVDSSSTGVKEITINQVLEAGTYWLAGVAQGGTVGMKQNQGADLAPGPTDLTSALISTTTGCWHAGVSGALPAMFTTTVNQGGAIPRVVVRVAA